MTKSDPAWVTISPEMLASLRRMTPLEQRARAALPFRPAPPNREEEPMPETPNVAITVKNPTPDQMGDPGPLQSVPAEVDQFTDDQGRLATLVRSPTPEVLGYLGRLAVDDAALLITTAERAAREHRERAEGIDHLVEEVRLALRERSAVSIHNDTVPAPREAGLRG